MELELPSTKEMMSKVLLKDVDEELVGYMKTITDGLLSHEIVFQKS